MNNKYIFLGILGVLLLLPFVSANAESAQDICNNYGYSYALSSFYYSDSYVPIYVAEEINITGNSTFLSWSSSTDMDGVIIETDCVYEVIQGSLTGSYTRENEAILNVVFCTDNLSEDDSQDEQPNEEDVINPPVIIINDTNNNQTGNQTHEVPEFTIIGLVAVGFGALATIVILRKEDEE